MALASYMHVSAMRPRLPFNVVLLSKTSDYEFGKLNMGIRNMLETTP